MNDYPNEILIHLFGGHDDDPAVLLPDHLPEVVLGVGQTPLRRDVRLPRRQQQQGRRLRRRRTRRGSQPSRQRRRRILRYVIIMLNIFGQSKHFKSKQKYDSEWFIFRTSGLMRLALM